MFQLFPNSRCCQSLDQMASITPILVCKVVRVGMKSKGSLCPNHIQMQIVKNFGSCLVPVGVVVFIVNHQSWLVTVFQDLIGQVVPLNIFVKFTMTRDCLHRIYYIARQQVSRFLFIRSKVPIQLLAPFLKSCRIVRVPSKIFFLSLFIVILPFKMKSADNVVYMESRQLRRFQMRKVVLVATLSTTK